MIKCYERNTIFITIYGSINVGSIPLEISMSFSNIFEYLQIT